MPSSDNAIRFPAILVLLIVPSFGQSSEERSLPTVPVNPHMDDCRRLSARYYEIIHALYQQDFACMRQPTHFGHADECYSSGTPRLSYTAWTQCSHYSVQICEVDRHKEEAVKSCVARATAIEAKEKADEDRKSKSDAELAKKVKTGNDLVEKAQDLVSFVADPKKFFIKTLGANNPALKRLLDGPERTNGVNADLGQEVYRFAQNYAKTGIDTIPSPLIRFIVSSDLRLFGEVNNRTFRELEQVNGQLAKFGNERAYQLDAPRIEAPRRPPQSDDECSVLKNENTSRELMRTDSKLWLELTKRCKQ